MEIIVRKFDLTPRSMRIPKHYWRLADEKKLRVTDISFRINDEKIHEKIIENFPKSESRPTNVKGLYNRECDCLKMKIKGSLIVSVTPVKEMVSSHHYWDSISL